MKHLLIILFCVFVLNGYSQVYDLSLKHIYVYEKFESKGEYKGGQKNGKWVDCAKDGAVYKEAFYLDGKPVGIWKVYYPDGKLRREIEYNDAGNIVLWKRYFKEKKIIEIKPDTLIDFATMMKISAFEEKMFEFESAKYEPAISDRKNRGAMAAVHHATNSNNSQIDFGKILETLNSTTFSGLCFVYNENCNLKNEALYVKGKSTILSTYYYKNSKLQYRYVYIENILYSIAKYDAKGNIKKMKHIRK